jgi:hypothetical protein
VDLTGRNSTNYITREPHLLVNHQGLSARVFQLMHGGFYTRDLLVVNAAGQQLRPHVDYVATYTYEDVKNRTGLETCGVIVIINPAITGTVYVSGYIVGGDLAYRLDAAEQVIQHLLAHPSEPIEWAGIVGIPQQFGPGELEGELWSKSSYTDVTLALDELAQVLRGGDQERLMEFRQTARDMYYTFISQFGDDVGEHERDHTDPHDVTKQQVGLGDVDNYPRSTQAQAVGGIHNASFMTPLRTAQAIEVFVNTPLASHVANRNNPHQVTRAQLNVPLKATVDALISTKLSNGNTVPEAPDVQPGIANNAFSILYSVFPQPGIPRSYQEMLNIIRTGIPISAFTSGIFNQTRLGLGVPHASLVLTGDGVWTSIQQLVNQYAGSGGTKILYIGYTGTDGAAMSHINATFANLTAYPVGTIVLYRAEDRQSPYAGDDESQQVTFYSLRGAIRTASGWTNYGGPPSGGHWNNVPNEQVNPWNPSQIIPS